MVGVNQFNFEISLSVLNHLGRNLYRSFITVIGEAISNSWDADAENVWISMDRENGTLMIKDDGIGMDANDFQNKFLKIGYSKRLNEDKTPKKNRPFIGRKGIGKLALLSCSEKVTVISRKSKDEQYIGGTVNNSDLDNAIENDLNPQNYPLESFDLNSLQEHLNGHEHGTIIYFEGLKEGIRNKEEYLRKVVALYFRFVLLDETFKIHLNDVLIGLIDLKDFSNKTEFLWNINRFEDPYIKYNLNEVKEVKDILIEESEIKGFIASVETPKTLKITNTDEKISIDLFVNGRLRKKDLMEYIPTERLAAQYLYGQIHLDSLDDGEDIFTSSREGVVSDNPKFINLLEKIRPKVHQIINEWDNLRLKHRKDGDNENPSISKKERSSRSLFNAVSEGYSNPSEDPPSDGGSSSDDDDENRKKIENWVSDLEDDAKYNFTSYAECFISENLVRKYILDKNIPIDPVMNTVQKWRNTEVRKKQIGGLSIDIRSDDNDLFYLEMEKLVEVADRREGYPDHLSGNEKQFTPLRNAVMHTSRLTPEAKKRLSSVQDNIKARVRTLLVSQDPVSDSESDDSSS